MSLLKVVSCFPNTIVGDLQNNSRVIISLLEQIDSKNTDVLLFPELALTGASLSHIFSDCHLQNQALLMLEKICKAAEDIKIPIILSLPINYLGKILSASAVIYGGQVMAFIPSQNIAPPFSADIRSANINFMNRQIPLSSHFVFSFPCGASFAVVPCPELDTMPILEAELAAGGAAVILCPSAYPALPSQSSSLTQTIHNRAKLAKSSLVFCNAGKGESSCDFVYSAFLLEAVVCGSSTFIPACDLLLKTTELDLEILPSNKLVSSEKVQTIFFEKSKNQYTSLTNKISKTPFIPCEKEEYYSDLFELQVASLKARMMGTGIKNLVIGISGGLDSTLALLVSAKAVTELGLPITSITAITMPGLGTSGTTLQNALLLLKGLGLHERIVSIEKAVLSHFDDISHNPNLKNTTYENAQARERTQILFDIANSKSALVVGTGDLSEIALGWCTFGGDHLASYGVNTCLTKDMVRGVVSHAASSHFVELRTVLADILKTPVSPELIPTENGKIAQKTEELLGEYEYHDFFLYYTIRHNFSPKKLLMYANAAFDVDETTLKKHIKTFYSRFYSNQFKRACSTEFAAITELGAMLKNYHFPSDLSFKYATLKISELDF